jgi:hypothetical protein
VDDDFTAFFRDGACPFPCAKQAAGGKGTYVRQVGELLICDMDVNSSRMNSAGSVPKTQQRVCEPLFGVPTD